jgi:hypothetical protein
MTTSLRNVKIASRGMGLEDCVASQEGYLPEEGLHRHFE